MSWLIRYRLAIFAVAAVSALSLNSAPAAHAAGGKPASAGETTTLRSGEPKYLLLQRSERTPPPVPRVRGGYAYGWFGAQPQRHPDRHFGYRQNFTQWSWQ